MRWEFHPEALEEYQEATVYYAERDPALALRFVEAVEDAIRRIVEAPSAWRVLDDDVRRCLTQVFPYGVLYTTEPEFIILGRMEAVLESARPAGRCPWRSRTLHSNPGADSLGQRRA